MCSHVVQTALVTLVPMLEPRSDSISFMVHASHAGAEFPDDIGKQASATESILMQMFPSHNGLHLHDDAPARSSTHTWTG